MTHTIEHSGKTWTMLRRGPLGRPVWPIEEYLVRTNHSPAARERIAMLNPDGKEEGVAPIGWEPELPE